jgi:hypothetical protein
MSTVADPLQALLTQLANDHAQSDARFAASMEEQQQQLSQGRKALLETVTQRAQPLPELVELNEVLRQNRWLIPAVQAFVRRSLERQAELQQQIVGENQVR